MQLLLSHGACLSSVSGPDRKNVLHWAATEGAIASVEYLARKMNMKVDMRCSEGRTAMMLAAAEGHEDVVKLLLAVGAEVGARSTNGGTALMWAACRGRVGVVETLVEEGVNIEGRDRNGHSKIRYGIDMVSVLILCSSFVSGMPFWACEGCGGTHCRWSER